MKQEDEDLRRVRSAVDQLGEHFDAVQIFCTRHAQGEEGGTVNVALGSGNWFARYGQTREWIVKANASSREDVKDSRNNDAEEAG